MDVSFYIFVGADYQFCGMIQAYPRSKLVIRDLANAKGVSISALVRAWIDERLDLPEAAEAR